MDDILVSLIVIAVTAIVVGGIFFFTHRARASQEEGLRQMALERGWTYEALREPLAWGFRLTTPDWKLESLSRSSGQEAGPGSSNVSMSTLWQAKAPGSTVLIGKRLANVNLGSFGSMLAGQVLQMTLGSEAGGVNEVQAGSEALRQKYAIWAKDEAQARSMLSPAVESALQSWPVQYLPTVKRTASGLEIEVSGINLKKPEQVAALILLGEALLAAR